MSNDSHSDPSSPIIVTRSTQNTNMNVPPISIMDQSGNNNNSHSPKTQQQEEESIAALYAATSSSYRHTLLVLIPYVLSKCAIAASNAFLQYLFGDIQNYSSSANDNNNNNTSANFLQTNSSSTTKADQILSSEATVLQWEFLIMGFCMGGMRAISVMAGKYCAQIHVHFMDLKLDKEEKRRQKKLEMENFLQHPQNQDGQDDSQYYSNSNNNNNNQQQKQKHVGFEEHEDQQQQQASDNDEDDDNNNDGNSKNDMNSNYFYSKNSRLFRGLLKTLAFVSDDDVLLNQNSALKKNSGNFDDSHGLPFSYETTSDPYMESGAMAGNTGCDLYDAYPTTRAASSTSKNNKNQNNKNNNNKNKNDDKSLLLPQQNNQISNYNSAISSNDDHAAASAATSGSHFLQPTMDENGNLVPPRSMGRRRHLPSLVEFRMFVKLRSVFVSGFLVSTFWGIIATLLFVFSKGIFEMFGIVAFDHHNHDDEASRLILANIQDYCYGFSIGVLPTLWLYATEQFLLGCHASGTVFVYGVIYAILSSGFTFLFASPISPLTESVALFSYHGSPLFGLGLGMSVAGWIGYLLLHLHIVVFDKYILRDLCTIHAAIQSFRERFAPPSSEKRRIAKVYSDWRASFGALKTICIKYFGLSTAMGLSNVVGLIASLVIAAVTLKDDNENDDDADGKNMAAYYSIASAYYQTLLIAILGASSAVSALVSASNGMAKHFRDKFLAVDKERAMLTDAYNQLYHPTTNEDSEQVKKNKREALKKKTSMDDAQSMATATTPEINNNNNNSNNSIGNLNNNRNNEKFTKRIPTKISNLGEDGPRLKTTIIRSLFIVSLFAFILAIPPMILPDQFIKFFGGDISQFNSTTIHRFQGGGGSGSTNDDEKSYVYQFLIPSFIAFCLITLAMCVSAALHALYDVIFPLVFNVIASLAGLGWTLGFSLTKSSTDDSNKIILASYGNVVAPLLYLIFLSSWLFVKYFYKKM